jgi:hypothetical protein
VSSDVIGYFQAITCFDRALRLDTFWIQRALWGKLVSTPCREMVNRGKCVLLLVALAPLNKKIRSKSTLGTQSARSSCLLVIVIKFIGYCAGM